MLAMVITVTVQSFYTLDMTIRDVDHKIQQAVGTYLMFIAFLPIPIVILGLIVPRKTRVEKFGTGRWRSKVAILLSSATLLTLGASFPRWHELQEPSTSHRPCMVSSKMVLLLLQLHSRDHRRLPVALAVRVDRRFHIPNGSKGPGDYRREGGDAEKDSDRPVSSWSGNRILSEEEVFDDASPVAESITKDEEAGFDRR